MIVPLLDLVLQPRSDGFASLDEFRKTWRSATERWPAPVDQAIVGGALADRLGFAFAAGYASAVQSLVPSNQIACLCVTEDGPPHPRHVHTRLEAEGDGFRLHGHKRWATLAAEGDVLLVAASIGWEGGRNLLRLVRVPTGVSGIVATPLPATPFTPEIPHYELRLEGVSVPSEAVLPGDGWVDYIRPFRTIEDTHVCAATVAYLLRVARSCRWPTELATRLVGLLVTLRTIALGPPAPAVHIALGAAFSELAAIVVATEPCWLTADPEVAARWHRDVPILGVAGRARAARLAAAWATFG